MRLSGFIFVSTLVLGAILLGVAGCGSSGISQADYDAVKSQLVDYQEQLSALQDQMEGSGTTEDGDLAGELKNLQSDYSALQYRYEQLKALAESDDKTGQLQALQSDYDALNEQYQALLVQPTGAAAVLEPEAIEQAIFALVNADRQSDGIAALTWGPNIYKVARSNSGEMAKQGDYQYTDQGVWQRVHIASGLSSAEEMAQSTLTIWKNNSFKYDDNIANPSAKYGAAGVVKAGDVFYITFVAATFK